MLQRTLFGQESAWGERPWPEGHGSFTPSTSERRWPETYGYLVGWLMVSAGGRRLQRLSPWPWPEGYGHT
jgi:hypothetical protein